MMVENQQLVSDSGGRHMVLLSGHEYIDLWFKQLKKKNYYGKLFKFITDYYYFEHRISFYQ